MSLQGELHVKTLVGVLDKTEFHEGKLEFDLSVIFC